MRSAPRIPRARAVLLDLDSGPAPDAVVDSVANLPRLLGLDA